MASEPKSKLISLRLSLNHYEYLRSQARKQNMSVSEFVRVTIERAEREFRRGGPSRTEVLAYLKGLSPSQREELMGWVEKREERKIIIYMNNVLEKQPRTTAKELCEMTSLKFKVPVTLDLRRAADLRVRSVRRKKRFVEKLEKENEKLS